MAIKYYRKLSPGNPVLLENLLPGTDQPHVSISFTTNDGLVGYYATAEQSVQDRFLAFMKAQRYGITEISEKEFQEDYVQKKTNSVQSSMKWREEMSGRSVRPTGYDPVVHLGSAKVQAAVGVKTTDAHHGPRIAMENQPPPSEAPAATGTPTGPTPQKPFIANVGKRKLPKS